MQRQIINFLKKQWLIVWIAVTAIMLTAMLVSAEYLGEKSTMNRVIVALSEQKMMFSSNILKENDENVYQPRYVSELSDEQINNGETYNIPLSLWNYERSDPSRWYPEDIEYNISFKLVDTNGDAITDEQLNGRSIVILNGEETITLDSNKKEDSCSGILEYNTNKAAGKSYTIRFPGNWDFEADKDTCVQVKAVPDNSRNSEKYKDLKSLGAVIGLKQLQSMDSSGWRVYISESLIVDTMPADFDAYNLVINGSGAADITLKIDTNKLGINKYFYDPALRVKSFTAGEVEYTGPDDKGIATIIIKADSSTNRNTGADGAENPEYRNRYDIQLYKKTTDPDTWEFLKETSESSEAWVTYSISDTGN